MRVIIESPYAGDVETNKRYLRQCLRDCVLRGESAYASHAILTQQGVLNDEDPNERSLGIELGFQWRSVAEKTVVYIDLGISHGMQFGIEHAKKLNQPIEFRRLNSVEKEE